MAVKLQMNVPETLELAFPDGLLVPSKFSGDQVMFSLTNGEKWYTDPFLASKIKAAGIGANQPFNVCKREVITGNRRRVEYEIEALKEPKTITDPRPTVYAGESRNGQTTAVVLGAGASIPAAAAPAAPSSVALMKLAAIGAIDVVLEAEAYARSRGMVDFAFDPGSIQDLVTSLFISMEKRGGRA